jgi:hypothetical protein
MHIAGSVLTLAGLLLMVRKSGTRFSQRNLSRVGIGLVLVGQALQLWSEYG